MLVRHDIPFTSLLGLLRCWSVVRTLADDDHPRRVRTQRIRPHPAKAAYELGIADLTLGSKENEAFNDFVSYWNPLLLLRESG
jgi:hypothetical protein